MRLQVEYNLRVVAPYHFSSFFVIRMSHLTHGWLLCYYLYMFTEEEKWNSPISLDEKDYVSFDDYAKEMNCDNPNFERNMREILISLGISGMIGILLGIALIARFL